MFAHVLFGFEFGLMSEVNCCILLFLASLMDLLNIALDFLYSMMLCVLSSLLSFLHFFDLLFLRRDSSMFHQGTMRGWVKVEFWGMDRGRYE